MNPKALIVDDENIMLDLLERILVENKYDVTRAQNGDQALKIMADEQFDLVITDIEMGEPNGVDVVKEAKFRNRDTIVIIVTGSYEATFAIDAFRNGADDYLLKPFSMTDMLERLHSQEQKHAPTASLPS